VVHAKNYETVSTLFCKSYAEKNRGLFFSGHGDHQLMLLVLLILD